MTVSEETLAAYADGELNDADAAAVKAAAAQDAALAARLGAHETLRGRLSRTYAPVLDETIPPALLAAASQASQRRGAPRWGVWGAMAASLVLGLVSGRMSLEKPLIGSDMVAGRALAASLDEGLASAPGGDVRIGLTFKAASGGYCRTFQAESVSGLACREASGWKVEALANVEPAGPDQGFRTASSLPRAIAAAVDARIAGEALDASAEASAREKGWR